MTTWRTIPSLLAGGEIAAYTVVEDGGVYRYKNRWVDADAVVSRAGYRSEWEGEMAESDAQARKGRPITTGVLDYFPDALLEVAECSRVGNEQHNPGQPLHWAKEKSTDEADALVRHLLDRGKRDSDGVRHSAKVAWRALAMLQREIEGERVEARPPDRPGCAHPMDYRVGMEGGWSRCIYCGARIEEAGWRAARSEEGK